MITKNFHFFRTECLTLISVLMLLCGPFVLAGGNGVGNGGDVIAMKFVEIANHGIKHIEKQNLSPVELSYLEKIKEAVQTTTVETRDILYLNQREVDAINYPDSQLIMLSRQRWPQIRKERIQQQVMISFHEYLGVAGIDDRDYSKSIQLVQGHQIPPMDENQNEVSKMKPRIDIFEKTENTLVFSFIKEIVNVASYECSFNNRPFVPCANPVTEFKKENDFRDIIKFRFVTIDGFYSDSGYEYWVHF